MIKNATWKMSGAVRTLGEDTRFDVNSVCSVDSVCSGCSDTSDTDNNTYQ